MINAAAAHSDRTRTYILETERHFFDEFDVVPQLDEPDSLQRNLVLELVLGRLVGVIYKHPDGVVVKPEDQRKRPRPVSEPTVRFPNLTLPDHVLPVLNNHTFVFVVFAEDGLEVVRNVGRGTLGRWSHQPATTTLTLSCHGGLRNGRWCRQGLVDGRRRRQNEVD